MYNIIVAKSGYAESGQLGFTVWVNRHQAFEDPIDALKSLADDLLQKYLQDVLFPFKDMKEIPKCHRYGKYGELTCEKCGEKARPDLELKDFEDFQDWVARLAFMSADEFGGEMEEWWPWVTFSEIAGFATKKDAVIEIPEYFETLICSAISENHPGLDEEEHKVLAIFKGEEVMLLPKVINPKLSLRAKFCTLEMRYPHLEGLEK